MVSKEPPVGVASASTEGVASEAREETRDIGAEAVKRNIPELTGTGETKIKGFQREAVSVRFKQNSQKRRQG